MTHDEAFSFFSLDAFVSAPDMGEHVGFVVKASVAGVALVRPLVRVNVHVVSERLQGVETSWRVANGTLVRLKDVQIGQFQSTENRGTVAA